MFNKREAVFYQSISNSLIIHEENTKKINTETEFGYVMKHLHKIKPTFISIFPLNTNLFEVEVVKKICCSKLLKNSTYGLVFQHTSRGLDILMKHSSECLIYYIIMFDLLPSSACCVQRCIKMCLNFNFFSGTIMDLK